ncbi:MAG: hypothetical protein AAGI30_11860 [Planctomycetota bacterium]
MIGAALTPTHPLTILRTTRLATLLLALPYTFVWATLADRGGAIIPPAFAVLALAGLIGFDLAVADRGVSVRLGLTSGDARWSAGLARTVRGACLVLAVGCALAAFVAGAFSFAFGILGVAAVLVVVAVVGGGRMLFIELTLPIALALVPAAVISIATPAEASAALRGTGALQAATGATALAALVIGAWTLLALLRDEAEDLTDALHSFVTIGGRGIATALLFLELSGVVLLGAMGAAHGWWHWSASALLGLAAMHAMWATAERVEGQAVVLLWGAGAVSALIISSTFSLG